MISQSYDHFYTNVLQQICDPGKERIKGLTQCPYTAERICLARDPGFATLLTASLIRMLLIQPIMTMQLAVFDLDYTIWQPEMYQLDGPPKLVSVEEFQGKRKRKSKMAPRQVPTGSTTIYKNKIAVDRSGTPITVFDGASHALSDINRRTKETGLRTAISSRTDEASWAYQLMKWLVAADGVSLSQCFDRDLIEISYNEKKRHFESLHRKTGIPFESMAFFDNEYWNIQNVGQLGVKCYHTPNGMTRKDWNQCLEDFGVM